MSKKKSRLKTVLTVVLSIVFLFTCLVFIYCNDSNVNNSGNLDHSPKIMEVIDISFEDSVDVTSISLDSANSIITCDIIVYYGMTSSGYRVKIKSFSPNYADTGWTALLLNSIGTDTLWQYEFKWDFEDTTWIGVNEISDGDEFYLEFLEADSNYVETFIQDSDTLIITYDISLFDGMRGDTAGYTQQEKDLIDSFAQEFISFYDSTSAINNNYYGDLLTYLLASEDFLDIVVDRVYDGEPPKNNRIDIFGKIGTLAGAGSFKCLLPGPFGWGNPVCIASVGTTIAIIIKNVYCWISGSC